MPLTVEIRKSEEILFKDLLDKYYLRLKGFAMTFLQEEGMAEEVVMDVFLKLWERKEKLDEIDHLTAYLFSSVKNTCHNYLRKKKKKNVNSLDMAEVEISPFETTPEDDLISGEMLETLNQVVLKLPPKCKMVFKLLREENLSRKETAISLGISVNTVDNQVAIAIRKISDALGIDISDKTREILFE